MIYSDYDVIFTKYGTFCIKKKKKKAPYFNIDYLFIELKHISYLHGLNNNCNKEKRKLEFI